jgi:putative ABC transport system substrate-binding protein
MRSRFCFRLSLLVLTTLTNLAPAAETVTVAITQIIEHPALDEERQGLLAALKDAGYEEGKNLKVLYQTAQGTPTLAVQIAQKMVSVSPNVMVAISTPSAQAALAAIGTKKIPLVFSAVTDPVAAKLVPRGGTSTEKVTGVSDALPIGPQMELLKQFIPSLTKVGVIYNPGEANSVSMVGQIKIEAAKRNIRIELATASSTAEVPQAAQSLVGKVQTIYVPNDNTAIAALESIVYVANKKKIPVFVADTSSVPRGAIAAAGYNRKLLGRSAGEEVVKILRGESPKNIPVLYDHPIELTVNKSAVAKIGFTLPSNLPATTIYVGLPK